MNLNDKNLGYKIINTDSSVIFKDNMDLPIHRWFHYTEGFSSEFVNGYLDKYNIKKGQTVFEPFMGSGTVGLCSKLRGINCIGTELSPLMYFISSIKNNFEKYDVDKIKNMYKELKIPEKASIEPPVFLRNDRHFTEEIINEVLKIKEAIMHIPECLEKDIFKLAFANILLVSSNAKRVPSFGYKKKSNLNVSLPHSEFKESLFNILKDIEALKNEELGTVKIINGDSRDKHFDEGIADIAITSPPYANGIDYVTDYQLEMGWLDMINQESKKTLRDSMVAYDKTRSSILREFYEKGEFYKEDNLMEIYYKLEEISKDYWKKDIHLVILKYFDDMYKVYKNTYDILKKGSRFILVVGDSLFQDVYVPADLLLAKLGEEVGFEVESIELARVRYSGGKNKGFKLRETIVTLIKR